MAVRAARGRTRPSEERQGSSRAGNAARGQLVHIGGRYGPGPRRCCRLGGQHRDWTRAPRERAARARPVRRESQDHRRPRAPTRGRPPRLAVVVRVRDATAVTASIPSAQPRNGCRSAQPLHVAPAGVRQDARDSAFRLPTDPLLIRPCQIEVAGEIWACRQVAAPRHSESQRIVLRCARDVDGSSIIKALKSVEGTVRAVAQAVEVGVVEQPADAAFRRSVGVRSARRLGPGG
jgi:hypothetical protein